MPGTRNNIIVVDDDVAMSRALGRLLGLAGFRTATFLSAEELLQEGGAQEASCLVLDVNLPGLSGFELHRRLVQSGMRQPVIFITAHDDPEWRTRAASAGASAYLTKP